jgi:hypothetical protein
MTSAPDSKTPPGHDRLEASALGCAFRYAGAWLIAPVRRGSENVLDLMFVAIVVVFFGLSLGYAAFCDRL